MIDRWKKLDNLYDTSKTGLITIKMMQMRESIIIDHTSQFFNPLNIVNKTFEIDFRDVHKRDQLLLKIFLLIFVYVQL